ncbi:PREDICTED: uncharacterized protein LOC104591767 [Nelumbo nucifera]|uniref:Uncharacterized protein LOC104591767 n=2 Tax=Nelumbo nucifera TaxID=4432 RepID=A0A1U7Z982_NELNU|nr:PREDICTED: uncharacterized protein LOC104591767 [Nelumbo nucifera]DAD30508.1 TPA_asm: hypothetical protein HUJ06_009359 [Nelumbo nucifera]
MKNLYHKSKGKVFPSPSSYSPSDCSPSRDALSVLNLLPAAILALASVLSLEDREVLAYMITRSIKTTHPSSLIEEKNKCKKPNNIHHNPPLFDCGCFDCYTSYWFRWDSSPNRELIHQAIEAFEDHLTNGENLKKNGRGKKKDKMSRRVVEKPADKPEKVKMAPKEEPEPPPNPVPEADNNCYSLPKNDVHAARAPENSDEMKGENKIDYEEGDAEYAAGELPDMVAAGLHLPASNHKALARKVLPDVLGLFNSRLWRLWSPNV